MVKAIAEPRRPFVPFHGDPRAEDAPAIARTDVSVTATRGFQFGPTAPPAIRTGRSLSASTLSTLSTDRYPSVCSPKGRETPVPWNSRQGPPSTRYSTRFTPLPFSRTTNMNSVSGVNGPALPPST